MTSISFSTHDHAHCIADCVAAVERRCAEAGLRLTEQRRQVLEILLAEHKALGAYEILEILRLDGIAAQPPVAYRALDFLVQHGFAHKVERLNAFIACAHPGEDHTPAFLICNSCKSVAEAPSDPARASLGETAQDAGFEIETAVVEALGTCPNCKGTAP